MAESRINAELFHAPYGTPDHVETPYATFVLP